MNNLNSVLVEGSLVRDAEVKTLGNGSMVCNFSIATNRYYKKNENFEKETSYFDVQAWGKLAEACGSKGQKGRWVRVVGRLKQDRWATQDGKSMSKIIIVPDHVEFRQKKDEQDIPPPDNANINRIPF